MYNLIVAGQTDAWDGSPYTLELGRFCAYTDDAIAQKFKTLDKDMITELQSFPTLFAYEDAHKNGARVGFIQRVRTRSGDIRIDYEFYTDLPKIPASKIINLARKLDISKLEMNTTHWAIKDVDILPVLIRAGLIKDEQVKQLPEHVAKTTTFGASAPLVISPTVFKTPNQRPEKDLVSVMMPFDAAFTPVYSAIQRSCGDVGLRCLRADDIWQASTVVQDVFNLLFNSHIVVVDFSGRNPNVMYETGIAHTLGREVIPISQSLDDVPFDLRHHRVLKYLPNDEGLASMQAALAERLKTLIHQTTTSR